MVDGHLLISVGVRVCVSSCARAEPEGSTVTAKPVSSLHSTVGLANHTKVFETKIYRSVPRLYEQTNSFMDSSVWNWNSTPWNSGLGLGILSQFELSSLSELKLFVKSFLKVKCQICFGIPKCNHQPRIEFQSFRTQNWNSWLEPPPPHQKRIWTQN